MKYAFYLIVVVTSIFARFKSMTTNVAASKGTSNPSPTAEKETVLTSYHAILSNSTPTVTNRLTMYDQTSTVSSPSMITGIGPSLSASENTESVLISSSMRRLAIAVSDTTTDNTLLRQGSTAKSSNAEGESKTPYSATIVNKSNPTATKTDSVNQASASIQATGTIKVISSQSLALLKASDSVETSTSSSNMIKPTVVMTSSPNTGQVKESGIKSNSLVGTTIVNDLVDTVPGSVITTPASKSSVLAQDAVTSLVGGINSSLMERPSLITSMLLVDQHTTISSKVVTQSTSKVIQVPTAGSYSSVLATLNATKPPIMVQSTMSPMVHATTYAIINSISSSRTMNTKKTSSFSTSLLVMPGNSTLVMVNEITSPMLNTTISTQSVVPKMTRLSTSALRIRVSSSSVKKVVATASTILRNVTIPIGRSMTTSSRIMENSTVLPMISTKESLRNTTMAPSTTIRMSVSPTSNALKQSASMSAILNGNKTSLTKNTTTASTIEMRSSLSFEPNMATQSDIVISTTSLIINVNGSSSIMNSTTMASTMGLISATMPTPNVTGSLVVNGTMLPGYKTKSFFTENTTTPSTKAMSIAISLASNFPKPSITVNVTASPRTIRSFVTATNASMTSPVVMNATRSSSIDTNTTTSATPNVMVTKTMSSTTNKTVSPVIKSTTMKTTQLIMNTKTSAIQTVTKESLTVNATMNATVVSNPTISIMTSITKSSPVVNGSISSVVNVINTLSISRHVLASGLTASAINLSMSMTDTSSSSSRATTLNPSQTILVRMTIEANCSKVKTSKSFKIAVRSACSGVLGIPEKSIKIKEVTCGSVIVDMEITSVNNDNVIKKLKEAVNKKQLIISYNRANLTVTSVEKIAPTASEGNDNKALIVYIVFGSVLGLAFLIGILALIVHCHRGQSTGMFHLPGEENLELSGFSGHTISNFRGGNFYGDLQPESSEDRLTRIPNESDPVTDSLEGNTENGARFGGAYLPAWKSLQTIDVPDVSRKDEDSSEMNDNPVLTYGKNSNEERRDLDENKGFVAYHKVGAV